jgi:hypothetical protein
VHAPAMRSAQFDASVAKKKLKCYLAAMLPHHSLLAYDQGWIATRLPELQCTDPGGSPVPGRR